MDDIESPERPERSRDSVLRRVLRPLGKLAHPFRGLDPLGLDMYPYLEGPGHGPFGLTAGGPEPGPGATDIVVELARIELNAQDGRPLDEGLPEGSIFRKK